MRRTLVVLAGLGVAASGVACTHTAGKCDCIPLVQPCLKYGLYTPQSCGLHEHLSPRVAEPVPAPPEHQPQQPPQPPQQLPPMGTDG
jgi:hypothetical protein